MKLSNIVHDRHQKLHHCRPDSQLRHPAAEAPSRACQPSQRVMASALTGRTYPENHSTPRTNFPRSPNPPPSPPVDLPPNCTLPSIKSLIGMADSTSGPNIANSEGEVYHTQHQQHVANGQEAGRRATSNNSRSLPPTPPLRPSSGSDTDPRSLSAVSPSSSSSLSGVVQQHSAGATDKLELYQQPPNTGNRNSVRPSVNMETTQTRYPVPGYGGLMPSYAYPSPVPTNTLPNGAYYPRPPPGYPPPELSATMASPMSISHSAPPIEHTNPWQHHHHMSPSASAAMGSQSQDRYVCQICSKSFSRPSSLRIHSHSHTGEKPFRCQHVGCGKAFSVRSNMKRHERGCHGGGSP